MTIAYLGNLSIAGALPGASVAIDAGVSGINGALPDILARLAALQAFIPLPVDFASQLTLASQILGSVNATIAIPGVTPPSIAAQIAIVAAQVADLLAQVAAINVQLSLVLATQSKLAAAGLHAFKYTGPASSFGGELSSAIGALSSTIPPGGGGDGIALFTQTPATADAMASIFKVTP